MFQAEKGGEARRGETRVTLRGGGGGSRDGTILLSPTFMHLLYSGRLLYALHSLLMI